MAFHKVRSLTAVILFFLVIQHSFAQKITPGDNAKAALSASGSTNVDFSTGIVNYSIPLVGASQNGYKVSLGLAYAGNGIKVDQLPSSVGLGWGLTGTGMVSRVIRGSKADEQYGMAIYPMPADAAQLGEREERVNEREKDGESDLFTLHYNDLSAKFLIEMNYDHFEVIKLEKNKVKIEVQNEGMQITGFKVTDESGNVYLFQDIEYLISYYKQEAEPGVKENYIQGAPVVWYLTEIQILNGDKIKFMYEDDVVSENKNILDQRVEEYSSPMVKYARREDLRNAIESLILQEPDEAIREQANNALTAMKSAVRSLENKRNFSQDSYERNLRAYQNWEAPRDMYDALNDQQEIEAVNAQIDQVMDNFDLYYQLDYAPYLETLNQFQNEFRQLLKQYYETATYFGGNFFGSYSASFSRIKLLKRIQLRDAIINLEYKTRTFGVQKSNTLLTKVTLWDRKQDVVQQVVLQYGENYINSNLTLGNGLLKELNFTPAGSSNELKYTFDYFNENEYIGPYDKDYWGFNNGKGNNYIYPSDEFYDYGTGSNPDAFSLFQNQYSRWWNFYFSGVGDLENGEGFGVGDRRPDISKTIARSLKKVTIPTGGSILLEYEANTINREGEKQNVVVGGLRIKSVRQDDGIGNISTIKYKYEFPDQYDPSFIKSTGKLVNCGKQAFSIVANYSSGISDIITASEPFDFSAQLEETGNSNVFYGYVEEVRDGGGRTGYKYFSFAEDEGFNDFYPYNLENLLLAKVTYDETGRMLTLDKNKYQVPASDIPGYYGSYALPREFQLLQNNYLVADEQNNSGSRIQLKAFPHGFNPGESERAYLTQDIIAKDGITYYNPYQYYYDNIRPRLTLSNRALQYQIKVNSFVKLIESKHYEFSSNQNAVPGSSFGRNDQPYYFEWLLQGNYGPSIMEETHFYYDNSLSVYPTRIETTTSKGKVMQRFKYAIDYDPSTDAAIRELLSLNCTKAIIEEQNWNFNAASNTWKVTGGTINKYGVHMLDGGEHVLLDEAYALELQKPLATGEMGWNDNMSSSGLYNQLFHENKQWYKVRSAYTWEKMPWGVVVTGKETNGKKESTKYSELTFNSVVQLENADPSDVKVFDFSITNELNYKFGGMYSIFRKRLDPFYAPDPELEFYDWVTWAREIVDGYKRLQTDYPYDYEYLMARPVMKSLYNMFTIMSKQYSYGTFMAFGNTFSTDWAATTEEDKAEIYNLSHGYIPSIYYMAPFMSDFIGSLYENRYNLLVQVNLYFVRTSEPASVYESSLSLANYKKKNRNIVFFTNNYFQYRIKYSTGFSGYLNFTLQDGRAVIDLQSIPNLQDAQEIVFYIGTANSVAVIAPEGYPFICETYNAQGLVTKKFDQNNNVENYFYDQYNRLNLVTDRNGNILKTIDYNFKAH
ncbi:MULTISPECIES: RHS repeat protein [Niastella]|uniref:RHS repeat protein n=1 Tax=Niastella soli TaxID=2821487 RepID=A0ABS3Z0B3_9BACT|nr:RHS repeat protein [Niastella soli]MBO9203610.1 RHS repeat protein [Niastella soli]